MQPNTKLGIFRFLSSPHTHPQNMYACTHLLAWLLHNPFHQRLLCQRLLHSLRPEHARRSPHVYGRSAVHCCWAPQLAVATPRQGTAACGKSSALRHTPNVSLLHRVSFAVWSVHDSVLLAAQTHAPSPPVACLPAHDRRSNPPPSPPFPRRILKLLEITTGGLRGAGYPLCSKRRPHRERHSIHRGAQCGQSTLACCPQPSKRHTHTHTHPHHAPPSRFPFIEFTQTLATQRCARQNTNKKL